MLDEEEDAQVTLPLVSKRIPSICKPLELLKMINSISG
jgi:hypothetical protein